MKKQFDWIFLLCSVVIVGMACVLLNFILNSPFKIETAPDPVPNITGPAAPNVPTFPSPPLIEPEITEPEEIFDVTVDEPDFIPSDDALTYLPEVPLSQALQETIIAECLKYSIAPEYIFGIIRRETDYGRYKATHAPEEERYEFSGDRGRSFGIMQIQERYVENEMLLLGCDDLCDNFDNVRVGIHIFYCHYEWAYKHWPDHALECAIMAYNRGQGGTISWIAKHGVKNVKNYSYVRAVLTEAGRIITTDN